MTTDPVDRIHRRWFRPTGPPTQASERAPIVLLHEGLGSISAWGGFPQTLADGTGRPVLAYDRPGYGDSGPHPGPWPAAYMHHEATTLQQVMAAEGLERCVLVGHSDGATIALLHPSQCPEADRGAEVDVVGIVSLSAHVFVEDVGAAAISALQVAYHDSIAARLRRHHGDADAVFDAWSDVWTSERFRQWTIDDELTAVRCPVLVLQGEADRFGTVEQVDRIVAAVAGPCQRHLLAGVDHWPHKEATETVMAHIAAFCDDLR